MDPPVLETERLLLTIARPEAAPKLLAYVVENAAHLKPWEPTPPPGYFTEGFWAQRADKHAEEFRRDLALRLSIFAKSTANGPIIGHANFTNIVRGAFQACHLGYSLDYRWVGKGVMSEALRGAIAYVFDNVGLHRVMANYMPTNERSGALLRRLGFCVEGYARDYLMIDGAWRDHVLTSLTSEPEP